jgi:hypothetical protein
VELREMNDILLDVSSERLMAHVRAIAADVRLSGSEGEARAFTYIRARLEEYGLGSTIKEYAAESPHQPTT